jgi:hypothetical protein
MSLQEIFQKVQSWLTELWSYLIPRTTLFVWVIIIGALEHIPLTFSHTPHAQSNLHIRGD